ncbi:unnamed protein product [Oncorhynchus mykiss]|uniref:Claudin n=1 Tax=Oncorhynchus mykiss TaxID=8022 RepID=A0A060X9L7_ONCMY|nr:unnamed protein product [Oncorhynchus mykiss]
MGMDIVYAVEMVEVVGIALGVIGLILTTMICALPTWIEITFIVGNVTNTEVVLYCLWMSCVTQGMGQTQCEVYTLHVVFAPHYAACQSHDPHCHHQLQQRRNVSGQVDDYRWNTFHTGQNFHPHLCFLGSKIYHHRILHADRRKD